MSLKDENTRFLVLCVACSIVLNVIFVAFQQFALLSSLSFAYAFIMLLYWTVPWFWAGMKEVREARARGEEASWKKNPHIKGALIVIIPTLFNLYDLLRRGGLHGGNIGIPVVDIIITIVLSIPLVLVLSLEVAFTIGLVRCFHHLNDPYKEFLEGLMSQEHGLEE